jgi:hypothetical protein
MLIRQVDSMSLFGQNIYFLPHKFNSCAKSFFNVKKADVQYFFIINHNSNY